MYLYNTATRKKEELKPIKEGKVGIYSCGPTVYSSPHIGNMYAYICWDILVRTLKYIGYEVNWVMNITDVGHLVDDSDTGEDKMEKGAKKEGLSVWEIAQKYQTEFEENLKDLNINYPDVLCKATDNIKEQISLVKKIEENGFSYQISDGIYFDTQKYIDYGKFANLDLEKIKNGARVEVNNEKKNPSDFALWKFSPLKTSGLPKRQMEWQSPWGVGFPGWHIECTAMSVKYLGEVFDIHTGGEDHINIHHTNEIAQGYGAFGKMTANYWIHNAFITFKGSKISKSSGGLYTIRDLIQMGYDPLAYRYLVFGSHYKRGIEFSIDSLKSAQIALNKLRSYKTDSLGKVDVEFQKEFIDRLSDNLATPEAIALIWKMMKSGLAPEIKWATLLDFDKVLGLNLANINSDFDIPQKVLELVEKRKKARIDKNWTESDKLRKEIEDNGFLVEDLQNSCKIRKLK